MKTIGTMILGGMSFFLAGTAIGQAENKGVWITIQDETILPQRGEDGELISASPSFQSLIDEFNISGCVQALPNSKRQNLSSVYEVTCDCDQYELIKRMEKEDGMDNPEPAPMYELLYIPDDYIAVFAGDYALDMIKAQGAWELTVGNPSVEIAISDSNYDLDHQELVGSTTFIQSPLTHPNSYHGTAVAVTVAGNTDNGIGKSSIGANCMLQLYSINYDNLLLATYSGARVVNVSWSSGCSFSSYCQEVINEVYENGTVIVAAAGNGATCGGAGNLVYPASFDNVISVTSVGPDFNHERTLGDPATTHQHNNLVDICAPGYDVALTVSDGWYLTGNGSSFAAPYVSGTIGLMLSVNPCLTPAQIEQILTETATDMDVFNPDYAGLLGEGLLDAADAVSMAVNTASFDVSLLTDYGCTASSGVCSVDVEESEGTLPFAATWNTGDEGMEIADLTAGVYTVSITDSIGCFATQSVIVDIPDGLNSSLVPTHVSCFEQNDGEINVIITGGTAPYTFLWSDGTEIEDREALSPGRYEIQITDAKGCEREDVVEIMEPEKLTTSCTAEGDFCEVGAGEIDLTVEGGTPDYSFSWCSGEISEDLYGKTKGWYKVDIEDANGCTARDSAYICGKDTLDVVVIDDGITAGIGSDQAQEKTVKIYPNPSSLNQATIAWQNMWVSQIEIMNDLGQIVRQIPASSADGKMLLSDLNSGGYLVRFYNENGLHDSKRLVIL